MSKRLVECETCSVYKYCGTMVSSVRLCRSIHKQKEEKKDETKQR